MIFHKGRPHIQCIWVKSYHFNLWAVRGRWLVTEYAGIHGRLNRSKFSKWDVGIHEAPNRSKLNMWPSYVKNHSTLWRPLVSFICIIIFNFQMSVILIATDEGLPDVSDSQIYSQMACQWQSSCFSCLRSSISFHFYCHWRYREWQKQKKWE